MNLAEFVKDLKLAPLATAEGRIEAKIVDAHLMFDAEVTVPVHQGRIDFNDATVEHVGPDSRMGVSRLGVYVDAPNGRSYLYQFPGAAVAGVEFEKRAALGPWVSDRGRLELQAFVQGLLPLGPGAATAAVPDPAALLLERTAVSGFLQLGDGKITASGFEADMTGSRDRRNLLRVHSEAVGRGLTVEMPGLLLRNVVIRSGPLRVELDELAAALTLRALVEGGKFTASLAIKQLGRTHAPHIA